MNKRFLIILLALTMLLPSVALFVSCNDTEIDTDASSSGEDDIVTGDSTESGKDDSENAESQETDETDSGDEKDTETDTSPETDTEKSTEEDMDIVYGDGENVKNSGIYWEDEAFQSMKHTIDESVATIKSSSEIIALLCDKDNETDKGYGKVYKTTEPLVITGETNYYGGFSAIIAEGGIIIKNVANVVLKDIVVKGDITIENSNNITFFKLDLKGEIKIDAASTEIKLESSVIESDGIAIDNKASLLSVTECKITADKGIISSGDELTVTNTQLTVKTLGVSSSGDSCIVRGNLIDGDAKATGVELTGGSQNGLIALNKIKGIQYSIKISEGYNCSVILNSAVRVVGKKSTNLYVIDNRLGGEMEFVGNKYLLCENNSFPTDGMPHPITNKENTEYNGGDLRNTDARLDVGANEDILPHTNKELFINMPKKAFVTGSKQKLDEYIEQSAKNGAVVIVPPGYYSMTDVLSFTNTHSGAKVYAYGVFGEKKFDTVTNANNKLANFDGGVNNIEIYGITLGYAHTSAGQIHILEIGETAAVSSGYSSVKVTAVASAGFINGFQKDGVNAVLNSATTPDIIIGGKHVSASQVKDVKLNSDGTMTLTLASVSNDVLRSMKYFMQSANNNVMMYCRIAGNNAHSINFANTKSVKLKDMTLYGYSAGLAFVGTENTKGIVLERVHNTSRSGYIIDNTTYKKYEALEAKYGVELVHIDENGNKRGADALVGSADSMHVNRSSEGFKVTSSIFENAADDGSNHRGTSYRLYDYKLADNKITFTVIGNVVKSTHKSNVSNGVKNASLTDVTQRFANGESIFLYTSDGRTIFNGKISGISAASAVSCTVDGVQYTGAPVKLTVDASAVNMSALDAYINQCRTMNMDNVVYVDNLSRNSIGSEFDNVLFQNSRSRGAVIKNQNVVIKNCTFRALAMAAVMVSSEVETWSESTQPQNVKILDCLFENTGFRGATNYVGYSPVIIAGPCKEGTASKDTLLIKDITISGCEFKSYTHKYVISVKGAYNVNITNNKFTNCSGENGISVETSSDIVITGNTGLANVLIGSDCKNVTKQ